MDGWMDEKNTHGAYRQFLPFIERCVSLNLKIQSFTCCWHQQQVWKDVSKPQLQRRKRTMLTKPQLQRRKRTVLCGTGADSPLARPQSGHASKVGRKGGTAPCLQSGRGSRACGACPLCAAKWKAASENRLENGMTFESKVLKGHDHDPVDFGKRFSPSLSYLLN